MACFSRISGLRTLRRLKQRAYPKSFARSKVRLAMSHEELQTLFCVHKSTTVVNRRYYYRQLDQPIKVRSVKSDPNGKLRETECKNFFAKPVYRILNSQNFTYLGTHHSSSFVNLRPGKPKDPGTQVYELGNSQIFLGVAVKISKAQSFFLRLAYVFQRRQLELELIQTYKPKWHRSQCCGQKCTRVRCAQVKIVKRIVCRGQEA